MCRVTLIFDKNSECGEAENLFHCTEIQRIIDRWYTVSDV
jgi:hypothetical protein